MSTKSNILLNKTVELAVVEKRPNAIMATGADVALLKGSSISLKLPKDKNGFLVNPLTKEEREFLEEMIGFNLDTYAKNTHEDPNYWISHRSSRIKLIRTGDDLESATIKLNLRDPIDFIRYKICLASPKVANKWADRFNGNYKFVLRDTEDIDIEIKSKIDKEDKVLEYLFSNKKSKKKMFDLLRLYGAEEIPKDIKYNKNTAEWMYTQLRNLTHSKKHIDGLYNIISLDESSLDERTFLEDAITCGVIVRYGSEYKLSGGGALGYTPQEVLSYLNKPEYQNTKFKVQESIDNYYKNKK